MPSTSVPRWTWASKISAPSGSNGPSSRSYRSRSSSALSRGSTKASLDMVAPLTDVLIYGDTFRSAELRHELPIGIPDPVLYAERDGTRHVLTSSMEAPRLAELGGLELHLWEELGWDELVAQGLDRAAVADVLLRRAVAAFEVRSAVVPESFPLRVADLLRADGVELRVDRDYFDDRRRVKSEAELAGMRRA